MELYRLAPHGSAAVLTVGLDREASLLVTGGESKLVHLFDLASHEGRGATPRPSAAAGAAPANRPQALQPMETFRCSSVVHSVSLTAPGDHLAVGLSDCTEVYQLFHKEAYEEVTDDDELMLVTRNGVINRQPASEIRVIGRNTQGVRLVNLDDGDELMDVARVIEDTNGEALEEENGDEAAAGAVAEGGDGVEADG